MHKSRTHRRAWRLHRGHLPCGAHARTCKGWRGLASIAVALTCLAGPAGAQDRAAASDVAQANNPLANFTAFNVHDYYIGELTDTNEHANQLWMRLAKPFSIGRTNWLMRASLPVA